MTCSTALKFLHLSDRTAASGRRTVMAIGGDRTKWYWTMWNRQNGMDKMVAIFIDSISTELNFYSVTTSHK